MTPKGPTTYYDKELSGRYISFQYSGKYFAKEGAVAGNTQESYTLTGDTHYDKRLSVVVSKLPDGTLQSDGNYMYRQRTPSVYAVRKVRLADGQAEVWVRNDGTEQTAMIAHQGRVATVSFVSSGVDEKLTSEVDALLQTFRWKQ